MPIKPINWPLVAAVFIFVFFTMIFFFGHVNPAYPAESDNSPPAISETCQSPHHTFDETLIVMRQATDDGDFYGLSGDDAVKMDNALREALSDNPADAQAPAVAFIIFAFNRTTDIGIAASFDAHGCTISGGTMTMATVALIAKHLGVEPLPLRVRTPAPAGTPDGI